MTATQEELIAGGLPFLTASLLGYAEGSIVPVGTTQGTAATLQAPIAGRPSYNLLYTTSDFTSDAGIVLRSDTPPAFVITFVNTSAGNLKIYPPVDEYMNGVQNAALIVAGYASISVIKQGSSTTNRNRWWSL